MIVRKPVFKTLVYIGCCVTTSFITAWLIFDRNSSPSDILHLILGDAPNPNQDDNICLRMGRHGGNHMAVDLERIHHIYRIPV
ncbi:unnamed protein product [Colias eurytheme]|nr:unnamed protein product [Colias eurytheme]